MWLFILNIIIAHAANKKRSKVNSIHSVLEEKCIGIDEGSEGGVFPRRRSCEEINLFSSITKCSRAKAPEER